MTEFFVIDSVGFKCSDFSDYSVQVYVCLIELEVFKLSSRVAYGAEAVTSYRGTDKVHKAREEFLPP